MESNIRPIARSTPWTVLILEDEAIIAAAMDGLLRELGAAHVVWARAEAEANQFLAGGDIAVAVVDWCLGRQTTRGLIERMWEARVPVLVITGAAPDAIDLPDAIRPIVLGKPASDRDIARALARLLRKTSLMAERLRPCR